MKRHWLARLDQAMDDRMRNWATWAAGQFFSSGGGAVCRSAEGRYNSPRVREGLMDLLAGSPWGDRLDTVDAVQIESVLCHPMMPVLERELLRSYYLWRDKPDFIARSLGFPARDFTDYQARSLLLVKNRLDRIFGRVSNRASDLSQATTFRGGQPARAAALARSEREKQDQQLLVDELNAKLATRTEPRHFESILTLKREAA